MFQGQGGDSPLKGKVNQEIADGKKVKTYDEDKATANNPSRVNQEFQQFKLAEYAVFYFGMVGYTCGVIEYEISY